MTDDTLTISAETRQKVNDAFAGFIGAANAINAIKRALMVALARDPVSLDKTFLLQGPPSTGKSEIARRAARCLALPYVQLDGKALKTRERLFQMIDDALSASDLMPAREGTRGGVPIMRYPPFVVNVDEIHLASEGVQQGFLTALERDDRTVLLDTAHYRRIANVRGSAFIFSTTRPADIDRALRSRCTEIELTRYSVSEVARMTQRRFSWLTDDHARRIAQASRLTPRVAFDLATDMREELWVSEDPSAGRALDRVLASRGIVVGETLREATIVELGLVQNDIRYLILLARERRPVGRETVRSYFGEVDPTVIEDDIESWLMRNDLIRVNGTGREITDSGRYTLRKLKESNGKS